MHLPIHEVQPSLLAALRERNRVILQAPTGSGKSTQVPQMILDAGLLPPDQEIVVLQPRKLAARMLARFVAADRGQAMGEEVGYQVRLERRVGPRTRIRYVTEGIVLRQVLRDRQLHRVGVLVFDEFHERHLYGDLTLACALRLQEQRPDLKLVLMSATLDTEPLQAFLPDAVTLRSEGRTFPVEISYLDKAPDPVRLPVWSLAAREVDRICRKTEGDVLIFMPGRSEIERTLDALRRTEVGKTAECLPLHGELPPAEQDRAVAPASRRKIIVATNIAETSLTIEGVRVVVDAGLARVARFDPAKGVDQLRVEEISQASADQRAGRAGRTAPGICLRLWTASGHARRPVRDTPEIHRVDLTEAVLTFRAMDMGPWSALPLPDPPAPAVLTRTEAWLRQAGAVEEDGRVTRLGSALLEFPLHARYARLMLEACDRGVVPAAARLVALLEGRPLFQRKVDGEIERERNRRFGLTVESDLEVMLLALDEAEASRFHPEHCRSLGIHPGAARQACELSKQFLRIAERAGGSLETLSDDPDALRHCVLAAFGDRLGLRRENSRRCDLRYGGTADVDAESRVREARLFVAAELRELKPGGVPVACLLSAVQPGWLAEHWPAQFQERSEIRYDEQRKRVVAERSRVLDKLVLEQRVSEEVSDDEAAALLAAEIRAGTVVLPSWDAEVEAWIRRVNCLAAWRPDWEIPPITEADREVLIAHALAGCRSRKDVKRVDVRPVVRAWLSSAQRAMVEEHAPERVTLASGRKVRVRYEEGAPPVISAILQDVYDTVESPRIAGGKVAFRFELLAPSRRPVQTTDDIGRFWQESYPLVKKEWKGRYPKHEWR